MTRPGWKTIAGSIALVAVAVGVAAYLRGPDPTLSPDPAAEEGPDPGGPWFTDVTGPAGITFVHFDPATEHHYIQETMGSGVAKVRLSFDDWKGRKVQPVVVEVPVNPPAKK